MKSLKRTGRLFMVSCVMLMSVFTISSGYAQTLEFSQVKMVTASESVPAGKIWKVESVGASSNQKPSNPANCNTSVASTQIVVDGNTIHVSATYMTNGSSCYSSYSAGMGVGTTGDLTKLPIWLPEGTSLATGSGAAFVSVVEFTVVP